MTPARLPDQRRAAQCKTNVRPADDCATGAKVMCGVLRYIRSVVSRLLSDQVSLSLALMIFPYSLRCF